MKKFGVAIALAQSLAFGASAVSLINETLETDGNGTRYYANEFSSGSLDLNHRTNTVGGDEIVSKYKATPEYINSGYFWNIRDLDGTGAPAGSLKAAGRSLIRFTNETLTGFSFEKLVISIDLAPSGWSGKYETTDFFDIQYSFDNALDPFAATEAELLADEANFTSLAKFIGSNQDWDEGASNGIDSGGGSGMIGQGAASGISMTNGNPTYPSGTVDPTLVFDVPFRNVSFDLDLTGLGSPHGSVTFALASKFNADNETFAWDNFTVEGIAGKSRAAVPDSSASGTLLGSCIIGLLAYRRFLTARMTKK